MRNYNPTQSSAIQDGDFNPNDDGKLFARQLMSSIARGEKHISLTLTGKSVLALARELSQCILAENATMASNEKDDDALLTKKECDGKARCQFHHSLELGKGQVSPARQDREENLLPAQRHQQAP